MPQRDLADFVIKPDARRALESVLTAGQFILEWTQGINEHRLWGDKQKRAAVEREFEIIAEARRRVRDSDPRTLNDICDVDTAIRLELLAVERPADVNRSTAGGVRRLSPFKANL